MAEVKQNVKKITKIILHFYIRFYRFVAPRHHHHHHLTWSVMYSFFRRVPKNVQSNNDRKKSSLMELTPPRLTMVSGTHFRGWYQRIAILLLISFLIIAMSYNRKLMYKKSSRSQTEVELYTLWIAMKCLMLQLNLLRALITCSIDRAKTAAWLAWP